MSRIDRYKGRFDDGYEAYREWVLPRMIEKGVLPDGSELTPFNPLPEARSSPATLSGPGIRCPTTRSGSSRAWPRSTSSVKDRRLWYAYNFIGLPPEQPLVSDREIGPGNHVLGVEFVNESLGERHETHGTAKLYVDDEVVAEAALRTQPGHFALCGEGLTIGRDSGDPVSKEYGAGFPFTGGKINEVEVNIGDDVYLDVEREFAAALARD
jgi:hypothetical protein